jgi:hypothetical protein
VSEDSFVFATPLAYAAKENTFGRFALKLAKHAVANIAELHEMKRQLPTLFFVHAAFERSRLIPGTP